MEVKYPAHIRLEDGREERQSVAEHCRNTAKYAKEALQCVGLGTLAYLASLMHDTGKPKERYRIYLEKAVQDPDSVHKGEVNHTFAGCRYVLEHFHSTDDWFSLLTSELIAYAIGAHHGQFDCIDSSHQNGFLYRLKKEKIEYQESVSNFLNVCASEKELNTLFNQAVQEVTAVYQKFLETVGTEFDEERIESEFHFYFGLLARLLLSAVIDGDRRDTAEFMKKVQYPVQPTKEERISMWKNCLAFHEAKLNEFPSDKPIHQARRQISDQCAAFAKTKGGIIRLRVPTGGGKTLSSLRFALAHAAEHGKSRIILTSSLLSVLDQNAQRIRENLPEDCVVLEHHSNVVRPEDEDERAEWEMLTEQWSAPVIITTMVQLLNTLFSGRSSCIRRFQALCNSVLVIDEAQTVPTHMLTLFNLAVNFLVTVCDATVVLCTATQPCLEKADHPLFCEPQEMVLHDENLWKIFQRTEIQDAGKLSLDEIPDFAESVLDTADSLLIVCNMKKEAKNLFKVLSQRGLTCFHLSASMCMAHRKKVLDDIQAALGEENKKVICVSTQVIEAGVDISFQRVIRLAAGMDSVVQSAGRCNRNGESVDPVPVYIVDCLDEKLDMLPDIQHARQATRDLLTYYQMTPDRFGGHLDSDASISSYFEYLYHGFNDNHQDMCLDGNYTLFDLLSCNNKFSNTSKEAEGYLLHGAYKTAGQAFSVFDENTTDVLVPYESNDGKHDDKKEGGKTLRTLLYQLNSERQYDFDELNRIIQKAKAYCVSLYPYQVDYLKNQGALEELFGGRITVLLDGFYDDNIGFTTEQSFLGV